MNWIVKILDIKPYTVTCLWNDGEVRNVDFAGFIKRKSLSPENSYTQIKNKNRFSEVKCDGTTLYWENGIVMKDYDGSDVPGPLDVDPEVLFEMSVLVEEKISQF